MAQNIAETILDIKVRNDDAIKRITEYTRAIDELKARNKQLDTSTKEGARAMAANNEAIKAAKKEVNTLSKEVQNNIKQQKAQEGSLKQLRAELSNLTKRYDEMSRAERNSAKGKELQKHINQVTTELKGAEEATQRYYRNVGNYRNSIAGLVTGNNQFAMSLMSMTEGTKGVGGAMQAIQGNVKAFGASLASLAANPVFLAIMGVAAVGMAFKWWKDYNDGLAEATRLTQQFTGLTGPALKEVRDRVQATADVFDKDYKETLQGVDMLVAQFGISWNEAINIMQKGLEAGADLNGDMIQQIQQYGPALRDAGVSAEELVAMIQQTRSGIFGKDGMELFVQASKRLRDMSKGTKDALTGIGIDYQEMQRRLADGSLKMTDAVKMVSDKLKEVGTNSQEAGEVMDNVFGKKGTKAGQEQAKALGELSDSLDELKGKEGEYGDALDELVKSQEELNRVTADLFESDGWDVLKKKAETYFNRVITWYLTFAKTMYNFYASIINRANAFGHAVVNVFSNIGSTFGTLVSGLKNAVKTFGDTLKGIGMMLKGIKDWSWDAVKAGWDTMLTGVKSGFSSVKLAFKSAGHAAASSFTQGWNSASQIEYLGGGEYTESTTTETPGGGGGGGGGKPSGGSKSGGGKSGSGGSTADNLKEQQKAVDKAMQDWMKRLKVRHDDELKAKQKHYELLLATVEKGTKAELDLQLEKLSQEEANERASIEAMHISQNSKNELLLLSERKYQQQRDELVAQYDEQESQRMVQAAANEFTERMMAADTELERLRLQLEEDTRLRDEAHRRNGESEEAYAARKLELDKKVVEDEKAMAAEEIRIQQAKAQAIAQISGAIGDMFEQLGSKNKAFLITSKVLAIAEVAIQQGIAIANAVRAAAEGSFTVWDLVANIATGIATVTASIVSAISSIKGAKFAKGGLIQGKGTGTSDDITAQVSNGESVMTANATAMFTPLLSALNQLGGGVPIVTGSSGTQLGEDMLAAAIAKGYALAPSPVVSVREITEVSNRVKTIENLGRV